MNTTCNISLRQHALWGQQASLGMGAVYLTSDRGTFNPAIEWGTGG